MTSKDPIAAIRSGQVDAILFEFYFAAESYLDIARFWQPDARILVDSVDVHFNRLLARARVSGAERDYKIARRTKRRELAVYKDADVVIAVSEEDRSILQRELGTSPVSVVPNIHAVPPLAEGKKNRRNSLLFIGNFHHDPNVDAMIYFCKQVLPLIKQEVPDVALTIVGDSAPDEVRRLAGENVTVAGFVPDTTTLLETSDISVAPLRYGGGLKGKIGEAMAHGLPVVTTTVGIEGFGLTPGRNVLVGDTADVFAGAVIQLMRNPALYESLRSAAWAFVNERYSVSAARERVHDLVSNFYTFPVKKLSCAKRAAMAIGYHLDRSVIWRFKRPRQ